MRKYITCLIGILCMAFTGVCFAGKSEVTGFSGKLIHVAIIGKDGNEHIIKGTKNIPLNLNTEINPNVKVGEGADELPPGEYTAIIYVFTNQFSAKGTVTLDNGDVYGSTGGFDGYKYGPGDEDVVGGPVFKKGEPAVSFDYKYKDTGGEWEPCKNSDETVWAWVNVSEGKLTVKEENEHTRFTLDENSAKLFGLTVPLSNLWFGGDKNRPPYWDNFNSDTWVKYPKDTGKGCYTRTDENTIFAPYLDPPEVHRL